MNTPRTRKPKRHNAEKRHEEFWRPGRWRSGEFAVGLSPNSAVADLVGSFIAMFNSLEEYMEHFASIILGTEDDIAQHVMRSIISAKARIDLLTVALERGERNAERGQEFDDVLVEYAAINAFRNDIAHAKYQTNMKTLEVSWIPPKGDPLLLDHGAYELFDDHQIAVFGRRVNELTIKISIMKGQEQERLRASSQQSSETSPDQDQRTDQES